MYARYRSRPLSVDHGLLPRCSLHCSLHCTYRHLAPFSTIFLYLGRSDTRPAPPRESMLCRCAHAMPCFAGVPMLCHALQVCPCHAMLCRCAHALQVCPCHAMLCRCAHAMQVCPCHAGVPMLCRCAHAMLVCPCHAGVPGEGAGADLAMGTMRASGCGIYAMHAIHAPLDSNAMPSRLH